MLPTVVVSARRFLLYGSSHLVAKVAGSSVASHYTCRQVAMSHRRSLLGARWYADAAGPNGSRSGQDEAGHSASASSSSSTATVTDKSADTDSDTVDASEALANARDTWRTVIQGEPEKCPPRASAFRRWIGKKVALHHIRNIAELEEEGKLDDVEAELQRGAPICLRFLANEALDGASFSASSSSLQPPFMEEALGERLRDMMITLRSAGYSWSWKILDIEEVNLQRLFLIVGASRGGNLGPTGILGTFGQQFVLTKDQTQRFLDDGLQSRIGVLQELMLSDMVLVGDVALRVSQISHLSSAEETAPAEGARETVEHVLRLEMPISHVRNYNDDEVPMLRLSSWCVADWNWACLGNHPALPPGVAAPW